MYRKVLLSFASLALLAGLLIVGSSRALAAPAATAAFAVDTDDFDFLPSRYDCDAGDFLKILTAQIKPPAGQSDLLIGVSMVSGLFTSLKQVGWDDFFTFSLRNAGIVVCATVDGHLTTPGCVLWNNRFTFDAAFQADIAFTFAVKFQAELLAQTFNFDYPKAGNGTHWVTVYACFQNQGFDLAHDGFTDLDARAAIGTRTLTVNGVNLKIGNQGNP
jgi:hypothetical protein